MTKRKARPRTANSKIRLSDEYRAWSKAVRSRDKWTCLHCHTKPARRKSLHAHHILAFAQHPAERFNVDNGMSLCRLCHRAEHRRLRGIKTL